MEAKRISIGVVTLLTAAMASTIGAVVSITPVSAAVPPAAPVGVNGLPNPGLASCYALESTGSNTPTFGAGGEESLNVTNYSSGTASVVTAQDNGTCTPTVTPGNTYVISDSYEASAPVSFTVYIRSTSGTWSLWTQSPNFYAPQTIFAAATWITPAIPAGVNGISFGMTLQSNGSVNTENYSLVSNGPSGAPPASTTGWSVQPSPNASATSNNLAGVSCTSSMFCVAVGNGTNISTSAIEQWTGTAWSVESNPSPSASVLNAVSCTSSSFCVAVGGGGAGTSLGSLIEQWNGTAWSIAPSPQVVGELLAVSCTSPTYCMAVGASGTSTSAEQWNGTAWSVVSVPSTGAPSQGGLERLNSVSCSSPSSCVAVGSSTVTVAQTLITQWNGVAWSIVPSPDVTFQSGNTFVPGQNELFGVSCTSTSACTAVGGSGGSVNSPNTTTLVEQWNGTAWSIVPSVNLPQGQLSVFDQLNGVSCTSASACTAVGTALLAPSLVRGPFVDDTVVEQWNGAAWSLVPSPNPSATSNGLNGVSCVSASGCTGVGVVNSSTLVESSAPASISPAPTPVVTGVSPSSGSPTGGTNVTITGSGFTGATWVTFDGMPASNVIVLNDSTITAKSPTITGAAIRDVMVVTPGGSSPISSADHFTYAYPTPVVTGVTPDVGSTFGNTSLTISGTGFTGVTSVTIDGVAATVAPQGDSFIIAYTPPLPAGTFDVLVTTPGGTNVPSSADKFTVQATPVPVLNSVGPTSGPTSGGTTVLLVGTGFTGATAVTFNGVAATNVVVASDSRLTATSPAQNAGTYDIRVTSAGGTSATSIADQFTYIGSNKLPTVTSLSPTSGPTAGGTSVTIKGTNFTGATQVLFGSVTASSFSVSSSTRITAVSPTEGAGTRDVTVATSSGTSATGAADQFTWVAPPPAPVPAVTSLSPTSGPTTGGTSVTIKGTGFTGATQVLFGTVPATSFSVSSSTKITAVAPAQGAGWHNVFVTSPGGTSVAVTADQFTYVLTPPVVSSLSQSSGPKAGGTSVNVRGSGFNGATQVLFGTIPATSFTVVSATKITAVAPPGTGTVDVTVTTPNGTSTTSDDDQYSYSSRSH